MKLTYLILAWAGAVSGCSVAARSPEVYRQDTRQVLTTRTESIRSCYDDVLKTNPGAQGRVTVQFDVETERGEISNVTIDKPNTTAPDAVCSCVLDNLRGLTILPPDRRKGEATWVYDFTTPPKVRMSQNKT